jgi:hypothetical protein
MSTPLIQLKWKAHPSAGKSTPLEASKTRIIPGKKNPLGVVKRKAVRAGNVISPRH